jgi:hypothetical protein
VQFAKKFAAWVFATDLSPLSLSLSLSPSWLPLINSPFCHVESKKKWEEKNIWLQ